MALEHALLDAVHPSGARRVLEVGCGNSGWLPHLARRAGVAVSGVDYSETGVALARERLAAAAAGAPGRVLCADLFKAGPEEIGRHDLVFSLGLVEHFTDLEQVLARLLALVEPGGTLFTEVPTCARFTACSPGSANPSCSRSTV